MLGVSLAPGVAVGDSAGVEVREGEGLCFLFGEALGEESGVGVGEDFFFFFFEEGDGGSSGVTNVFGVAGFSASPFFFGEVECL